MMPWQHSADATGGISTDVAQTDITVWQTTRALKRPGHIGLILTVTLLRGVCPYQLFTGFAPVLSFRSYSPSKAGLNLCFGFSY